jgi:hypothetical protein
MMRDGATAVVSLAFDGEQGRLVIEALAECPFKTVFELIGRLNRQANAAAAQGVVQQFAFSRDELALLLASLARLPYQRVHQLMRHIEQQLALAPVAAPRARKRKSA